MAFIPLGVFLIFCILLFIVFLSYDMHALAMGGFLGLLIGAFFAKDYGAYWKSAIRGIASPNAVTIILVLFIIGMFSQMIKDGQAAQGFIWIADSIGLKGGLYVAFTFLACCIIATATGSSIGTMFAAYPVFFTAGTALGADPAFLAGAITSGCIFGDNLAPISDTTIASAATQLFKGSDESADIAGVVKSRFKYAFAAGVITFLLYILLGGTQTLAIQGGAGTGDPEKLFMLIPVAALLVVAVASRDIFKAISVGLITGIITGLVSGIFTPQSLFSSSGELGNHVTGFLAGGINGMMGTVTLVISVFGIMGVMQDAGTLDILSQKILDSSFTRTERGTEIVITMGACLTGILFGGVTSGAILTFGPIVNRIGRERNLHPYRRANLLDGFVNTIPVLIPFLSVFVFISVALSGLSPVAMAKGFLYPGILFLVLLFSVVTGWGRRMEE